jgi:putative SOS response-associated peptidase YedK
MEKNGTTKTPYAIVPSDEPLFAFAGLWENWRDKAAEDGAEWIRTCAIITRPPNALVAPIHDRMPVILPQETWHDGLARRQRIEMNYSVKNDDAGLIEPMMATGGVTV